MRRVIATATCTAAVIAATFATPAAAQSDWSLGGSDAEFRRIEDRGAFLERVGNAPLRRFGILVTVTPDGAIGGNAFGRDVSGRWEWREGYFCRDIAWGSTDLGANCQTVAVAGDVVRFRSDRGQGRFADLRID